MGCIVLILQALLCLWFIGGASTMETPGKGFRRSARLVPPVEQVPGDRIGGC